MIRDSAEAFARVEAEYELNGGAPAHGHSDIRTYRIRGGFIARQEIPTSVRSAADHSYCYVLASVRMRTSCVVFHPAGGEGNHTFVRACMATVLCQAPAYHCVHGGAVEWGGRGVLLVGPHRSGKTTLLLRLHQAGAVVLSDNLSFVHDGRLVPFFLMDRPRFNVGPVAHASLRPVARTGSAATTWNADGRRLVDVPTVTVPPRSHVALGAVIVPTLSTRFDVRLMRPEVLLTRHRKEIVRPELEMFATKFKSAWFYRWKTTRYWRRQLRAVPVLGVSLDKHAFDASCEQLLGFLREHVPV